MRVSCAVSAGYTRCSISFASSAAKRPCATTRASTESASSPSKEATPFEVENAANAPVSNSDACSGSTNAMPTRSPSAIAPLTAACASAPCRTGSHESAARSAGAFSPTRLSTWVRCALKRTFLKAAVTRAASNEGNAASSKSSSKSTSREMVAAFRLANAWSRLVSIFSFCLPLSSPVCS